jgi:lipopolysaccharide export system permease protein
VLINRYLSREVLNSLLAVVAVLMLAFISQQVVRYLSYAAMGKIPTRILLELVSFEIPYLLALLLPLAAYLGIILAYGRLYTDNEMLVMQMAGFNSRRLLRLTLWLALAVAGVVWVLMLWVNPVISAKRQQVMSSDEATLHLIETLIPGRFQVSPDGQHVMYVETISVDHQQAQNVFIAEAKKTSDPNQQNTWTLVFADEGYQMKDPQSDDPFFVTQDGYRYEGAPGQNDYKITQYKRYAVRMAQTDAATIHKEDESLSSLQLLGDYGNSKRAAELQWRLSMGLSAILLALLAVPLSIVKPRQGRFVALFPAIVIYVIYINLLFVARRFVDQGSVSVWLGMWWVHILMLALIALVFYLKTKQWKLA